MSAVAEIINADPFTAQRVTKLQIEASLREIMEQLPHLAPEHRKEHLMHYLYGRFNLDRQLVERFLGEAML